MHELQGGSATHRRSGTTALVAIESRGGVPTPQSLELLAAAVGSDLTSQARVVAVSLHGLSEPGQEMLRARGCAYVLVPDVEISDQAHAPDGWTHLMSGLSRQCESALVMLPHSLLGSEVAARVAFRLGYPVVTNCESIALGAGEVAVSRACFGGRLKEEVRVHAPHTVLTMAANASFPARPDVAVSSEEVMIVEQVTVSWPDGPPSIEHVRRHVEEAPAGPSLETASVVVSGGRGLGGAQGFSELSALAARLGGAAGASRVACDLGWCPKSWQIGLSGRSIRADWYIAFGISGASHHMAGCSRAGSLVAINNDRSAEIFRHATYGVVADARAVLQELIRLFESEAR